MDRSTNMTAGSPMRLILAFSIPLILTNIGQQLYSVIDAIIVGRGVGVEAFAALGATDWLYWLDLWMIWGLTQGFGILASQTFGSGNRNSFHKAVTMSIVLAGAFGILMTAGFGLAAKPLLDLLRTPEQIFGGARLYLTAMYCGTLIVMAYNMAAALLRAVGDGKSPLIAMGIAGVMNILLDLLLVVVFRLGILGAALATLSAQLLAFFYCLNIIRRSAVFRLKRDDWKADYGVIAVLCRLGIPLALQSCITVIGGIIAQGVINSYGYIVVAGFTATNKLHGLLDCSASAIESADATYIGQNWGAKKTERIDAGVRSSIVISLVVSLSITAVMLLFGRQVVSLFISSSAEHAARVLDTAYQYLFIMACFLVTAYLMHVYRGVLQGLGNSIAPMLSGIVEFAARVSCALFLPLAIGQTGVFFMDGAAWASAGVFLGVWYYIQIYLHKRTEKKLPSAD